MPARVTCQMLVQRTRLVALSWDRYANDTIPHIPPKKVLITPSIESDAEDVLRGGDSMDLTTALEVKRELETLFASRAYDERERLFALGISTPAATTGYRIALRAPSQEDLPEATLDEIRVRTAGELDVRFVGRIAASGAHAVSISRGVAVGASVAHRRCTAGTLGFIARRVADGAVGFVSNNHVIAAEDRGQEGDEILHPAPADRAHRSCEVVGHLSGGYPRLKQKGIAVDCAFARLVSGISHEAGSLEGGRRITAMPAPPHFEPEVLKIGRTTGLTTGRVTAFDLDVKVHYSFGVVRLLHQIEIESSSRDSPFTRGGDSGSLLCTRGGFQPVGLVFARSAVGGHGGYGLTYANPIEAVLAALGVTFLV